MAEENDDQYYNEFDFSDIAVKPGGWPPEHSNPMGMPGHAQGNYPAQGLQPAPPGQASGPRQKPRGVVKAVKNFWIPQAVPFTSTANENVQAYSKPVDFDVFIMGAFSDLELARVKLIQTNQGIDLSVDPIQINAFAGNVGQVQPMRWWRPPTFLPAQATLRGDFSNVGTEAAGTVSYMTVVRGSETAMRIRRSSRFYLVLDLSSASLLAFTSAIDDPLLIWGAVADEGSVATTIQLTDDRSNYAWSSQQMLTPSFAGIENTPQPIVYYKRPYLLSPRARIRANYSAAHANGAMSFICERLQEYEFLGEGFDDTKPTPPGPRLTHNPNPKHPPAPVQPMPVEIPQSECQMIYENDIRGILSKRFTNKDSQTIFIRKCKQAGVLNTNLIITRGKNNELIITRK